MLEEKVCTLTSASLGMKRENKLNESEKSRPKRKKNVKET